LALTVDDAVAAFAAEVAAAGPVAVEGGRTRWGAGGALREPCRLVRAPAGVVEYHPEEMTVRVRAGTSVADLDAALGEAGQRSALPERGGTVGGAVAVGENHLGVLGRGPLRSSVLQVRYVSAEGRVVTGGGPTVKNVSGYDLPRLLTGSLGTLGLLAEVILRTNPRPAESRWLASVDADPTAAFGAVLRPGAVLWDGATTWVLLEGHPGDVDAGAAALAGLGTWDAAGGPPPLPGRRWSLAPAEVAVLDRSLTGPFVASVGVGTVFATEAPPKRPLSPPLLELHRRVKAQFDPSGRLTPGRSPEER
jgi:FAD/FMN-containing dehydrogenase